MGGRPQNGTWASPTTPRPRTPDRPGGWVEVAAESPRNPEEFSNRVAQKPWWEMKKKTIKPVFSLPERGGGCVWGAAPGGRGRSASLAACSPATGGGWPVALAGKNQAFSRHPFEMFMQLGFRERAGSNAARPRIPSREFDADLVLKFSPRARSARQQCPRLSEAAGWAEPRRSGGRDHAGELEPDDLAQPQKTAAPARFWRSGFEPNDPLFFSTRKLKI